MPFDLDSIYQLLPAVYRARDAQQDGADGPEKGLVRVISREVAILQENLAQLYDDEFIETCAEWVVPYIADLLGVRGLHAVSARTVSQRAYVANTLDYRRRKGTAAVLEELARDVTGWNANAVEFFQVLGWTQHIQHVRPTSGGFADVRPWEPLERVGSPFDSLAHTVDVRRVESRRGRYNIPNVGLFLWRLDAHRRTNSLAVPLDGQRFFFNPLGIDTPLVTAPAPQPTRVAHLSTPLNVPMPLNRRITADHLADYYGTSFAVHLDGVDQAGQVEVCNLSDVEDSTGQVTGWAHVPPDKVAVDPVLGRLAFPTDQTGHRVEVTYSAGFAANVGGGEYSRQNSFDTDLEQHAVRIRVPAEQPTIQEALNALSGDGVIEVAGSGTFSETPLIDVPDRKLELRAADGSQPVLALGGDLVIRGQDGEVTVNGFLVTGGALQVDNGLNQLVIRHCTLAPGLGLTHQAEPLHSGAPSLVLVPQPGRQTTLILDHCIAGPLRVEQRHARLTLLDTILDPAVPEPAATTLPTLVSGDLSTFPSLAANPTLNISIGTDGPFQLTLGGPPADLAAAAAQLEAAIHAAQATPAFQGARVLALEGRLVVAPGVPGVVAFQAAGGDPTATLLQLVRPAASRVGALLGAPPSQPLTLRTTPPSVWVTVGQRGPEPAHLSAVPTDLTQAATLLQAAIRALPGLQDVLVTSLGGALLVVPAQDGASLTITSGPGDTTSAVDLGLASSISVLAGSAGGEVAGPTTELQRCTLLGPLHIEEASLASDCIFLGPLTCDRRQAGCVRFSFLSPGSLTPRRYRCTSQPRPLFTSLEFGQPGYCQLARANADSIWRGASDEAEIGVFHDLFEPQRETNLLVALDEYLRFAMEAGVFYPTWEADRGK